MKIVYVPLDDRPMNLTWVKRACGILPATVVTPGREEIGSRVRPADFSRLSNWLSSICAPGDVVVCSLDALLYGGLVQGRTYHDSSERCDKSVALLKSLRQKLGREGKIFAFFIWKRVWGNVFNESDLARLGTFRNISNAIAEEARKRGLDLPNYLRFLSRGVQLADWMDKATVTEFAKHRLQQRRDIVAFFDLTKDTIDLLHIAREDNDGKGIVAMELGSLLATAKEMGTSFSTSEGGDEAGMLLLSRAINTFLPKPIHNIFYEVTNKENLRVIPPYEGSVFEETLATLTRLANIASPDSDKVRGAALNIIIDGFIEKGDSLLEIKQGHFQVPQPEHLINLSRPCKSFVRQRVHTNVTSVNGVNYNLVEWFLREENLPLLVVQSGTIANRIGYSLFLCSVIRHGLEKKIPEPGVWKQLATIAIATYLEEVIYCGYLRTWAINKFGGFEPEEAGTQALAEVEMSNFLREIARKKFNGAEFLERKIEVLDARIRLPWGRWFEAEVEVNVQYR